MTSLLTGVVTSGTAASARATRCHRRGRRQDRHHQRRAGCLVRRVLAGSAGAGLGRLRRQRAHRSERRPGGAADLGRVHEAGRRGLRHRLDVRGPAGHHGRARSIPRTASSPAATARRRRPRSSSPAPSRGPCPEHAAASATRSSTGGNASATGCADRQEGGVEAPSDRRRRGTARDERRERAEAGFGGADEASDGERSTQTSPRSEEPSAATRLPLRTVPVSVPDASISTWVFAETFPRTTPAMTIMAAEMFASTSASGPTRTVPVTLISPSKLPPMKRSPSPLTSPLKARPAPRTPLC